MNKEVHYYLAYGECGCVRGYAIDRADKDTALALYRFARGGLSMERVSTGDYQAAKERATFLKCPHGANLPPRTEPVEEKPVPVWLPRFVEYAAEVRRVVEKQFPPDEVATITSALLQAPVIRAEALPLTPTPEPEQKPDKLRYQTPLDRLLAGAETDWQVKEAYDVWMLIHMLPLKTRTRNILIRHMQTWKWPMLWKRDLRRHATLAEPSSYMRRIPMYGPAAHADLRAAFLKMDGKLP